MGPGAGRRGRGWRLHDDIGSETTGDEGALVRDDKDDIDRCAGEGNIASGEETSDGGSSVKGHARVGGDGGRRRGRGAGDRRNRASRKQGTDGRLSRGRRHSRGSRSRRAMGRRRRRRVGAWRRCGWGGRRAARGRSELAVVAGGRGERLWLVAAEVDWWQGAGCPGQRK
jgi:hypothetical protein